MCRNIHRLYNFHPPATAEEIENAARQFVRKVSGFNRPSQANEAVFERAVNEVARATRDLLDSLVTRASPRTRDKEAARARTGTARRFPS